MIHALFLLSGLLGFAPPLLPPQAQPLTVVLHRENAATERLPQYLAGAPIAVRVAGQARAFDAVTLTATGPDGTAIRAPLTRTPDGFAGDVRLAAPGTWTLALATTLGSVSQQVATIPLDVVDRTGWPAAALLAFVLALAETAGGAYLIAARRRTATIRS